MMIDELYAQARMQEFEREREKWRLVRLAQAELAEPAAVAIKRPVSGRRPTAPGRVRRDAPAGTPPPAASP